MRPEPEMIPVLIDTAKALKGSQRRTFMARTVSAMGRGGQIWAEAHLGWNRQTIRKGMHEFRTGMACLDITNNVVLGFNVSTGSGQDSFVINWTASQRPLASVVVGGMITTLLLTNLVPLLYSFYGQRQPPESALGMAH